MNRVDGVILGVGVVVLAASIVGVFLYDDTAGTSFEVTFQESDATELEELTDGGTAGEYTFEANITNVTGMANGIFTVEVTRNGAVVSDDSVEVTVEGPEDQTTDCSFTIAAGASGSGTCEAEATVQEQPEATTISAENGTLAEEQAEARLTTAGSGVWNVTVAIQGGQGAPLGGGASYTITVTPAYTFWDAEASVPGPDTIGGP